MTAQPRFARIASVIGDPTRARMLSCLLDGRFHTAKELAVHAGVVASTASRHLKLLVDEGLATVRPQGRHKYYMLADANVAHALEALLRVADGVLPETGRWQAPAMRGLRHARTCYGHLAGELGVRLHDRLIERGWVRCDEAGHPGYSLTPTGMSELNKLGLPVRETASTRRMLYGCVDWSQRRDHFAGPVAVQLLELFLARGWLRRADGSRALTVSPIGQQELLSTLLGT